MRREDAQRHLQEVPGWNLADDHIVKEYKFKTYSDGLEFACALGKIAEEEGHHPDILIKWKRVRVTLSTHAIKGLSENDFIMAAKTERLLSARASARKSRRGQTSGC
jgi:4a-hydroxytetrahydrobiopterin dehydratase